jgi:hypothetical protein
MRVVAEAMLSSAPAKSRMRSRADVAVLSPRRSSGRRRCPRPTFRYLPTEAMPRPPGASGPTRASCSPNAGPRARLCRPALAPMQGSSWSVGHSTRPRAAQHLGSVELRFPLKACARSLRESDRPTGRFRGPVARKRFNERSKSSERSAILSPPGRRRHAVVRVNVRALGKLSSGRVGDGRG